MLKGIKRRMFLKRLFEGEYTTIDTIYDTCIYCGEKATHLDHVPPLSFVEHFTGNFLKVPACKPCNYSLGNSLGLTLLDRRIEILKRIRKSSDSKRTVAIIESGAEVKQEYSVEHAIKSLTLVRRLKYMQDRADETWNDYIELFNGILRVENGLETGPNPAIKGSNRPVTGSKTIF